MITREEFERRIEPLATKEGVERVRDATARLEDGQRDLKHALDGLTQKLDGKASASALDALGTKVDGTATRGELAALSTKVDGLATKVDGLATKLDGMATKEAIAALASKDSVAKVAQDLANLTGTVGGYKTNIDLIPGLAGKIDGFVAAEKAKNESFSRHFPTIGLGLAVFGPILTILVFLYAQSQSTYKTDEHTKALLQIQKLEILKAIADSKASH